MTEFEKRLNALLVAMQGVGVELAAIGPTANMRYLAGFAPHADERLCLLLISPQATRAVVPKLNAEEWAAHSGLVQRVDTWADEEGPANALAAALTGLLPVKTLAIDGAMRADFLLPLLAAGAQEIIAVDALIAPLRARKSPEEIEALARAAAQADRAMQAAVAACQPGVSEAEVAWAAEEAFRRDGAEEVSFTLVAAGANAAYPHHHSSQRILQKGEAVLIDIGASLEGYKSDITRMVFLGDPPTEFLEAYAAVLMANERGRAAVRPGITAREVDYAARSTLEAKGYGPHFIHRTGHGLGMEVHEPPWITATGATLLEAGMVFSIEPGVYYPGRFGIRIEDIMAVTEAGGRCLTGSNHDLVVKA
jgi:Xaa-Pro aminopeptidase